MVPVHDTLSHCVVEVYEASTKKDCGVQLTEWAQNCIYLCYKRNNLKN